MENPLFEVGQTVTFNDGEGSWLTGHVTRANWGRAGQYVSVRDHGRERIFTRLATEVQPGRHATGED